MKVYNLSKTKFLVKYHDDYFVTNNFTSEIIDKLNQSKDVTTFSSLMGLNEKKANKILQKFNNTLNKNIFYQRNLYLPSPLKVQWKITNICNLKCKHCYLGELDQKCLITDELFDIANKIIESNVCELTITGGEALTVTEFPQILELFIKNEVNVNIFTNGTLLEGLLNKVQNHEQFSKFIQFNISLDGLENCHDKIRGNGAFQKTIQGIKTANKYNYPVLISCVINKVNIDEIPLMIQFLNDFDIKSIQLTNLILMGNATGELAVSKNELKKLLSEIKCIINNKTKLIYGDYDEDIVEYYDEHDNSLGRENWKCCAGISRCTIDHLGNVYCCPFCKDYCLGNIRNQNLIEIWKSESRFKFLKYLLKTKNSKGRMCVMTQRGNEYEENK